MSRMHLSSSGQRQRISAAATSAPLPALPVVMVLLPSSTTPPLCVNVSDPVNPLTTRQLRRAVHTASALDRQTIRNRTIRQFDRATMVKQYLAVYRAVLAGRTSTR